MSSGLTDEEESPEDGTLRPGLGEELIQSVTGDLFVNYLGGSQDIKQIRVLSILNRHPLRIQ